MTPKAADALASVAVILDITQAISDSPGAAVGKLVLSATFAARASSLTKEDLLEQVEKAWSIVDKIPLEK